jgi:hypothetical protein
MLTEDQMQKILKLVALGREGEVFQRTEAVAVIKTVDEYGIHGGDLQFDHRYC